MHGFELRVPASPSWVDLIRDLVAIGASPFHLGLDRFHDLLVLSEQICSAALQHPGVEVVDIRFAVGGDSLRLDLNLTGGDSHPDRVSELAMSVMADDHWHSATNNGSAVGFKVNR